MAVTERLVRAPIDDVYAVLANGWSYSDWVVGTAHIRAVDDRWPAPGTAIHHKAGPWPFSLQDRTEAIASQQPTSLVVAPHMWPLGEARVSISLTEVGPAMTKVRLAEEFESGPLRWVRTKLNDLLLHYRNRESLRRLADLAVQRSHPGEQPTT